MGNILDYLDWRGDIPLSFDGFGDVDAFVLSQFAYVPLEGIVPFGIDMSITVAEAFSLYDSSKIEECKRIISFEQDNILFEKMANSRRFRDVRLSGYVNYIDSEMVMQFSAVSCTLEDGTVYVAFSGTDDTVAGWKEDLNISYKQTPSQFYSVKYMNENFGNTSRIIRTGGHSKGGNLAVYSSAFCDEHIRDSITEIYSFDGPGFIDEITDTFEYRAAVPKVKSYVPELSVVGILLSNDAEHKIVKSTAAGIKQHLAYNWEILGKNFIYAGELSKSGAIVRKAVTGWLDEMDEDERKKLVETLFSVLEAPEKDTLKEISKGKWAAYTSMLKAVRGLSAEKQNILRDAIKKFARNGRDAIAEEGRMLLKENENGT